MRCDQPRAFRENRVQLQTKKIVISRLDNSSADREHARIRRPVGFRNPFTPEEITRAGIHPIIFLHAFLLSRPGRDILAPDPPELEILVTSTGHDNVAGGAKSAEQDTGFMCVSNLGDTFEGGIGMDHDRVCRVAVSGKNLLPMGRPVERSDLRRCFQCVQARPSRTVPYIYGRIASPTAGGQ